jgi:uncharacterized protein YllA (UPF0747 family)
LVNRALAVRARVVPRPDAPFDLLYDPIVTDLVSDGPIARERFDTRWRDTDALRRLAERKRAPLASGLADALGDMHRRLGAPSESFASLERLTRGEVVCAIAGQQPAPLAGPLYSLHKIASAVGLAAVVHERTGVACVPMFWMHAEDSDFPEIRSTTVADTMLQLREPTLPASAHRAGELVGTIAASALEPLHREALEGWAGLPGREEVAAALSRALARGRDLGEVTNALVLELFGARGLVVVDPRLPAFRAAARPIIDRYVAQADAMSRAASSAGAWLEQRAGKRPLNDAALESFVFAVDDGVRRKVDAAEARARGASAALSPSVALRPVVQDGVLPTVAMACGAAEIAYLAQLREVFALAGVAPASPVPRLTATWLPPPAIELLEQAGVDPWTLVTGADAVLKAMAERELPADVRARIEDARQTTARALEGIADAARAIDASLPQLVESARGKIDYQLARLHEGVAGKVRHRLERRHPAWARVRYYLLPGDRLQERRIASFEPIAYGGLARAGELCERAADAAREVARGSHAHLMLEL